MKRIAIIGAGITGLAAAHRILERCAGTSAPVEVRVLDADAEAGGIIKTEERDGFLIERGPDSFITEKPDALSLVRRLGLEPHLIDTNAAHRRSFVVRNARLLPVPDGFNLLAPARLWPFVTSGIFSWPGKARIAMDLVIPRRPPADNADESLAEFVRRRLGKEALERMAQPMAGGIYTADPETLSLQATLPRFLDIERQHRSLILGLRNKVAGKTSHQRAGNEMETVRTAAASGARYSMFRSFDQGMQLLTDQLLSAIMYLNSKSAGTRTGSPVRLNTRVESLARHTVGDVTQWVVRTANDETFFADAICLALPAYVSSRFLRRIDADLAAELAAIPYASSATINLAYQRNDISHRLNGFGFVVPFIEKRTVMACTFSSVKFPNRAPDGHVLLRAFVGGALQPELVELDDDELIARVQHDLSTLLGVGPPPMFTVVSKWQRSMPQYFVGHVGRVRSISNKVERLPGLALAGNAFHGPGIPDCVRSGESAADKLLDALQVC
ncbi:MAG TPA: protoporphyrinogen oxidase [Pyrinomonadaceae bacterium]|nr:protoporphyrinogen oxidase [Pyrinomonadaceae bacterium]